MLYCIWSVIFIYHISYSLSSVSETIYNLQYHKSLTFYCVIFFSYLYHYFKWYHSMSFHILYYPLMWYRIIYCIYVCLHTARICIFACMHVLVDHGMITCGIISWSCLYGFLLVDANAVVVLLVIDPGAIWEKQQGFFCGPSYMVMTVRLISTEHENTWRTMLKEHGEPFGKLHRHNSPTIAETLNWKIDANSWCHQCAPWWFPMQLNEFCRYTHQISCCKKIIMKMSKTYLYLKQRRRKNPTMQFGPVPLESSSP